MKSALNFIGLDVTKFNVHSFRIGAETSAFLGGKSESEIKKIGSMVYIRFSAIHSDSFLELISDIWIIGSSIIKWTSEHTKNRATGRDLGLDKQGYNVTWVGHQGMLWYMVDNVISIMLSWRRPPAIILIHCGGNDLCKSTNGKWLFSIKSSLADIQRRLPDATIIWSYILPWRNWLGAIHNEW